MKNKVVRAGWAIVGVVGVWALVAHGEEGATTKAVVDQPASVLPHVNVLTDEEKAAGWELLFDGVDTKGWRNYQKQEVSAGWQVREGALCRVDKTAGDLITIGEYDNFELELDYKVPANANSGVMYRVSEERAKPWQSGVEVQILDNTNPHGDPQKSGWAYGLYRPAEDPKTGKPVDATKPVGEWNHLRIVVDGNHVEHWMNGVKYVEYEIGSEDWGRRVKASKFGQYEGFGMNKTGHIALQGDHGNVCFANIKIRKIGGK